MESGVQVCGSVRYRQMKEPTHSGWFSTGRTQHESRLADRWFPPIRILHPYRRTATARHDSEVGASVAVKQRSAGICGREREPPVRAVAYHDSAELGLRRDNTERGPTRESWKDSSHLGGPFAARARRRAVPWKILQSRSPWQGTCEVNSGRATIINCECASGSGRRDELPTRLRRSHFARARTARPARVFCAHNSALGKESCRLASIVWHT